MKLLDPVERLPVHAHPDRAFAWTNLGSEYGKTEAWIVVATREAEAEVWLGLREPVERDQFREWIERQDTEALIGSLNHIAVDFAVDDRAEPAGRFAVLLVLEGDGEIDGERVRAGDAFVLPAACEPFDVRGGLRFLRCVGGAP